MFRGPILVLFALMSLSIPSARGEEDAAPLVELATFSCEITPPLGHPLCGGWIKPAEAIQTPQLAKGLILRNAEGVYALCALDWCELRNDAHDLFREKIAEALGTSRERVAVQCLHQHNAPLTDSGAQLLLDKVSGAPVHADLKFLEETARRVATAAGEVNTWNTVTHLGAGMARVERVAATRRVHDGAGGILVRYSSTRELALQEAIEGKIDPYLRTVAFLNGTRPLACLHYYATHPQSYYGDGQVNWDFVGMARERAEEEVGGFQVYFTGCGGDVTAGKYNDGSPERRPILADRLHDAIRRSLASLAVRRVEELKWKVEPLRFQPRGEETFSREFLQKMLADPNGSASSRGNAAIGLAWLDRVAADHPIDLTCLSIGDIRILHLPGEPFVEFQLFAQRLREDLFVAVAGYGDGGPGYVCTEASFAEGGYEPTASLIEPKSEWVLKGAIEQILSD